MRLSHSQSLPQLLGYPSLYLAAVAVAFQELAGLPAGVSQDCHAAFVGGGGDEFVDTTGGSIAGLVSHGALAATRRHQSPTTT